MPHFILNLVPLHAISARTRIWWQTRRKRREVTANQARRGLLVPEVIKQFKIEYFAIFIFYCHEGKTTETATTWGLRVGWALRVRKGKFEELAGGKNDKLWVKLNVRIGFLITFYNKEFPNFVQPKKKGYFFCCLFFVNNSYQNSISDMIKSCRGLYNTL